MARYKVKQEEMLDVIGGLHQRFAHGLINQSIQVMPCIFR